MYVALAGPRTERTLYWLWYWFNSATSFNSGIRSYLVANQIQLVGVKMQYDGTNYKLWFSQDGGLTWQFYFQHAASGNLGVADQFGFSCNPTLADTTYYTMVSHVYQLSVENGLV